jgi:hypothetical protein
MGSYTNEKAEARKRKSGEGAWEDYEGRSVGEAIDSLKEESRKIAHKEAVKAGGFGASVRAKKKFDRIKNHPWKSNK